MKISPFVWSIVVATTVVGCSSAPPKASKVDEARLEIQKVSADPLAQDVASATLQQAQDALAQAEQAQARHSSADKVEQPAYLALRYAQIAQAQTREARARAEIEAGKGERDKVLLEARAREIERQRAETLNAKREVELQRSENLDVKRDAERSQAQAAQLQSEVDQLKAQQLQAQQTERGMVVTLGDVLFDTGRSTLKPGADLTLDRLAEFLSAYPAMALLIEGHADTTGNDQQNVLLSERRAEAVQAALAAHGIDRSRIQTRGLGSSYPVATNATAAGRQQNRRVEIIFSDDKGQFLSAARRPALR